MRTLFYIISWLTFNFMPIASGWAHGVEIGMVNTESWRVKALYDDGEPVSYAAVEIKAPNTDLAFQNGRTDRNGCFFFSPDGPGVWKAIVSDGMGHQASIDIPIDENTSEKESERHPPTASLKMNRPLGIFAGLSLIVGIYGFWYGWKARRGQILRS